MTVREAMYARLLGEEDKEVTRRRLARHSQPTEILERRALPDQIYAEVEHLTPSEVGANKTTVTPQKIFLSYAREDASHVDLIYSELASRGHNPWMDTKDILPGERWELAITKAVQSSDYFVACLSRRTVTKRGYIQKEIRLGLDQLEQVPEEQIYFIPVRLEACDIPQSMAKLHVLDLSAVDAIAKLVLAIEKGAERKQAGGHAV